MTSPAAVPSSRLRVPPRMTATTPMKIVWKPLDGATPVSHAVSTPAPNAPSAPPPDSAR